MNIEYTHSLSADEYCELRKSIGWTTFPKEQDELGLRGTTYMIVGRDNGKAISLTRMLWDGGHIAFLADVIVHPNYQKNNIGRSMMNIIREYLKSNMQSGWKIMIMLMSSIGKEPFYEKLDFVRHPYDDYGSGMLQWLEKE